MDLIIGLGNPEKEYSRTRHNMGFDTINQLARQNGIEVTKKKFESLYGMGWIKGEKVILVKPQTYMNLSGQAVKQFMDFYKIKKENLFIIYDDMDIEPGKIKIRKQGGAGGHNGMKSILQNLGNKEFPRIRIGIGRPTIESDNINYVIGQIPMEEREILKKGINRAVEAIEEMVQHGVDSAMNKFN